MPVHSSCHKSTTDKSMSLSAIHTFCQHVQAAVKETVENHMDAIKDTMEDEVTSLTFQIDEHGGPISTNLAVEDVLVQAMAAIEYGDMQASNDYDLEGVDSDVFGHLTVRGTIEDGTVTVTSDIVDKSKLKQYLVVCDLPEDEDEDEDEEDEHAGKKRARDEEDGHEWFRSCKNCPIGK